MRDKDEILRNLAHDIAGAKLPRNRMELLLAAILEPLIDIRDIMDQNTANEDQIREMMEDLEDIEKAH